MITLPAMLQYQNETGITLSPRRSEAIHCTRKRIENVAFRNPDGTIALVAVNTGGTQNFQVSFGGQSFGYSLPAAVLAVFAYRVFNLWLPLGPSAFALYQLQRRAPDGASR